MTAPDSDKNGTGSVAKPGQAPEQAVYLYESAEILERSGTVPIWLWIVAALLLAWGAYYLVAYWSAPVAPG
ncbi:MAG TPA: hypothetical protein VGD24_04745 [Gallionella sp.]